MDKVTNNTDRKRERERERERPVPVYPMQRLTSLSIVHLGIEASQSKVLQRPSAQCEPAKYLTISIKKNKQ